jgi:hypothetical protein
VSVLGLGVVGVGIGDKPLLEAVLAVRKLILSEKLLDTTSGPEGDSNGCPDCF